VLHILSPHLSARDTFADARPKGGPRRAPGKFVGAKIAADA